LQFVIGPKRRTGNDQGTRLALTASAHGRAVFHFCVRVFNA
jgi:hypothetical protein